MRGGEPADFILRLEFRWDKGNSGVQVRSDDLGEWQVFGYQVEIARADYEIVSDGEVIGRVTSGAPSPTLGKSIGLGYVPRSKSEVGQRLDIRVRNKDVEAVVVKTPFLR